METTGRPAGQTVILRGVSWGTYESLLADHEDRGAPRFAYDQGELEIMSPSPEHEKLNRDLALLVDVVAEEFGIDVYALGSTTFRHEELGRGFEPDSCFYIQNEEHVRGKDRIDLDTDPPPDLVIEIDVTSPSLYKLPIYAKLGVPEVWRHDGKRTAILRLERTDYVEVDESTVLPPLSGAMLSDFMDKGKSVRRTVWLEKVREWAQGYA